MKTFTLRLTDIEAEALDRIAYARACSKNDYLRNLLAEDYCDYEIGGTMIGKELVAITYDIKYLIDAVIQRTDARCDEICMKEGFLREKDIIAILKTIEYIYEKLGDDITPDLKKALEEYREEYTHDYGIAYEVK